MLDRDDYINQLKSNTFNINLFEDYYNRHSSDKFVLEDFNFWVSSGLGKLQNIVQNILIPYYNNLYNIVSVQNKDGVIIHYV